MKRITILLVALLALVVSACASEQATPSVQPTPAVTEEPTPEPSSEAPEPSESADASIGAFPSFDLNGDPELAARFPDTVGGQPLQVQSMRGDTFMSIGGSDPAFEEFLDSVDAELSDVSVAFGGAASGDSFLSVGAFRILGASEDDLEREFIAASEDAGDITGMEQANVGGKDVWTAVDPSGETDASVYLYTKDDTLYFLTGSEAEVAEILEALP
ncbi:MAG TPA: hypothetical protein VJ975_05565 [Candidatus Limnocylindria bacterium]|nr:hypothetical protein [Candidatus Limnocylindria bacterium]